MGVTLRHYQLTLIGANQSSTDTKIMLARPSFGVTQFTKTIQNSMAARKFCLIAEPGFFDVPCNTSDILTLAIFRNSLRLGSEKRARQRAPSRSGYSPEDPGRDRVAPTADC
jgi:hypothetical protein